MFSDNLLYLRNLKGLSQEQVAEAVGISRQSYSKWEQGDTFPDIDKCDKLANFYGVTIDSLIHSDEKIGKTKIAPAPHRQTPLGNSYYRKQGTNCNTEKRTRYI